ncbi:hypothetical protein COZ22_01850 [bacterium (Candidatus Howlettbacteria) CG_4_10_14_3_um_filter_37_10]|nr:MAG: hypothetical protein COZ22_01850 [bacterium (Candidatus Howlettbacteria) CG_4_10_14_3_um_filter_37_10]PJB06696.1 MAG: hypothetical protein CO123_01525 [bacterium (Candidatus Howlettbacteria) CG_4_9_14_3_um_filter_37_10]
MNSFSVKYLVFSVLSISALAFMIFNVNPEMAGTFKILLFFGLILASFFSVATFVIYNIRKLATYTISGLVSLREGFLIGLLVLLLAFLSSVGLLGIWDAAFLVIVFLLIEILMLAKKGNKYEGRRSV